MDKKAEASLFKIEQAQAELRECIGQARELADESERLIQRHRDELKRRE
jgi:hypothetical protein